MFDLQDEADNAQPKAMSVDECVKVLDERWGSDWWDTRRTEDDGWIIDVDDKEYYESKVIAIADSLTACLRQAVENVEGQEVT